jgi:hypothetical protein
MTPEALMKRARQNGMFRKDADTEYWHAGLFLLIAASNLHSANTISRQHSRAAVEALLALGVQHGFVAGDDLRTRLEGRDFSDRTFVLARAALYDVPGDEIGAALREAGFNAGGAI